MNAAELIEKLQEHFDDAEVFYGVGLAAINEVEWDEEFSIIVLHSGSKMSKSKLAQNG